ncbi:MAG: YhcH/YjgK/YiaL family protein [Rikenellaceae bacterium]
MILDSFKNASLYYGVCPRMQKAFELVAQLDLVAIEPGVHKLDGDEIFINVLDRDLKEIPGEAKLEVHDKYADIQILITGEGEGFGWLERKDLTQPQSEFNTESDVQLFDDEYQTIYTIRTGQFTILMPEDAHAPMIGKGHVKKAIVKVLI